MNRAWAVPGLFLLALAGCSTSPAGPSNTSVMKVAYSFKAGQNYRYHYTSTLDATMTMGSAPASPVKAQSSADETWKVVSIDATGNATIDETLSNLKTTVTGSVLSGSTSTTTNTTTTTTTQHFEFQVSPAGEILSGGSTSVPPLALAMGQGLGPPGTDQFLAVLPDHPVKPGDTWSKTYSRSSPFGQGSESYTTEDRFLRYEDLPGGKAAVIQTTATVPLDFSTDLGQAAGGTGGASTPAPPPGSPASGTVSMQGTYKTNTTTWFDVKTDQVARMITSDDIDQTTNFSGIAGLPSPPPGFQLPPGLPSPPPGAQVPAGLQSLLGPQHFVGKQTFRLDLA